MVAVGIVIWRKFVYSAGIVHQDLMPANILMEKRDHPKIGDLGSARFCGVRQTMTSTSTLL
jgi:serine/threonine protein kinase